MSEFQVQSSTSTVSVLFAGDQPAAKGPFSPEIATEFAQNFQFGALGLQQSAPARGQGQIGGWLAEKGQHKEGSKIVLIDECRGNLGELQLRVSDSDTRTAEKALAEVWKTLCSLYTKRMAKPATTADIDKLGTTFYESTATVKIDREFLDFFPTARLLRDDVMERLKSGQVKSLDPVFRFVIEVPVTAGRRVFNARVSFEPRLPANDPSVLFTSSPLRSEQHHEVIRTILERSTPK